MRKAGNTALSDKDIDKVIENNRRKEKAALDKPLTWGLVEMDRSARLRFDRFLCADGNRAG